MTTRLTGPKADRGRPFCGHGPYACTMAFGQRECRGRLVRVRASGRGRAFNGLVGARGVREQQAGKTTKTLREGCGGSGGSGG